MDSGEGLPSGLGRVPLHDGAPKPQGDIQSWVEIDRSHAVAETVVHTPVDSAATAEDPCRVFAGNSDGRANWAPSVDPSMSAGESGLYPEDSSAGRGWVVVGVNLMERDPLILLPSPG